MPALWLQDTDFWLLSLWKCKPLSCVWFLATQWTVACQAPLSRNYLGKNAGVDSHFLLQGIFLTQGSNPGLLWCRQILYHLKREVAQSCPTLCESMDCVLPGLSVHGIFQARVLESGLPFPSPGDIPDPGIKPRSPTLQADALPHHLKSGDKSWKQRGDMWTWLFICCFAVPFLIPYLWMKLWNKVRKGSVTHPGLLGTLSLSLIDFFDMDHFLKS